MYLLTSYWKKSDGVGNGSSLQYSGLANPMDRGAWWATVHEVAESNTTYGLNNNMCIDYYPQNI